MFIKQINLFELLLDSTNIPYLILSLYITFPNDAILD